MITNSKRTRGAVVDGHGNIVWVSVSPVFIKGTATVDHYKVDDPKHAKWREATDADIKSAAETEAKRAAKEKKEAEAAHAAVLKAQEAADKAAAVSGGPIRS